MITGQSMQAIRGQIFATANIFCSNFSSINPRRTAKDQMSHEQRDKFLFSDLTYISIRYLPTSFCRFQTPSLCVNSSCMVRHLGRMRHSKPHMLNSKLGLSLLYTDTKLLSQLMVVTERGRRFLMSQNTARPLHGE